MNVANTFRNISAYRPCAVLLALLLWAGGPLAADEWRAFTTANSGLPGNAVRSIAVAPNGNIWAGTDGGVAVYNGVDWQTYTAANSGLPHNNVRSVAADGEGTIWIGGEGGLAKLAGNDWTVFTGANSDLPDDFVRSVAVGGNGKVWVATGSGIASYNGSIWEVFTAANSDLPTDNVQFISVEPASGNIWIGTEGHGAVYTDLLNWTVYRQEPGKLPSNIVLSIAPLGNGNALIGTWGGGVAELRDNNWTLYNGGNSGLPHDWVNALARDACGRVWHGTRSGGIGVRDADEWRTLDRGNSGLPDNQVLALRMHPNGDVWIGSAAGLARLEPAPEIISAELPTNSFCAGAAFSLAYRTWGSFAGNNTITAQLSDHEGSFVFPTEVGAQSGSCRGELTISLPEDIRASDAYKLRLLASNPVTLGAESLPFRISAQPVVHFSGRRSICEGDTAQISVEGDFVSYEWSTGSTEPQVNVSEAGTLFVTVTDTRGCTAVGEITVEVSPLPKAAIAIDTMEICIGEGGRIVLSQQPQGSYSWSPANGLDDPGAAQPEASPLETTTYVMTFTNDKQCVVKDSIAVVVNPLPDEPVISQNGDSLVCSSTGVFAYLWYYNGSLQFSEGGRSFRPQNAGIYSVVVVDSNGCTNRSADFSYPTSDVYDGTALVSLYSYPQPLDGDVLRLVLGTTLLAAAQVQLSDLQGREVFHSVLAAGSTQAELNLAGLPPGAYLLQLRSAEQRALRLVLKR